MGLKAVQEAIGTRLATITGLQVFDYVPSMVVPPTAFVGMPDVEYDLAAQGNKARMVFPIRVVVAKNTDEGARDLLMAYMDLTGATTSVRGCINADPTLGGQSNPRARLLNASTAEIEIAGVSYLGANFDLEVWA